MLWIGSDDVLENEMCTGGVVYGVGVLHAGEGHLIRRLHLGRQVGPGWTWTQCLGGEQRVAGCLDQPAFENQPAGWEMVLCRSHDAEASGFWPIPVSYHRLARSF